MHINDEVTSQDRTPDDGSGDGRTGRVPGRGITLALLTGVYFFYLLDRNAVLVTQEMFKAEFQLSDGQVGLVTGLLYGLAYALVGLPMGRIIERADLGKLLALLVAVWSSVTVLCGFATRFWHLGVGRFIVGAAESGGAPAALMIIRDLYPEHRRAAASSIFFAGAGLGGIVSFLLGGYVAQKWGWRAVFFIYGAPGLVLAVLIWMMSRRNPRPDRQDTAPQQPFWSTVRALMFDRTLLPIYVGSIAYTFSMSGIASWLVPYLMRVHDVQIAQAGLVVALAFGLLSTIGGVAFGFGADVVERRRAGGMLILLGSMAILNGIMGLAVAFAPGLVLAIIAICFWGVGALAYSGTVNAAIGKIAPSGTQGIAFALFAVLCNLVGAGLGPLCAGILSDLFQPTWDNQSLRPALAICALFQILSAAAFLRAAKCYGERSPD